MFKKVILLLIFAIVPSNCLDIDMHIKANGVGHTNHDINLNCNNIVFKDFGRGDVILQKESRELYLNNGLHHKMMLSLESLNENLWQDRECIKNYNIGASVHLSYNSVKKLDSSEFLKTDNKTLHHQITTDVTGKVKMDVNVVNTTNKLSIFEFHETLVGHFDIDKEIFVK